MARAAPVMDRRRRGAPVARRPLCHVRRSAAERAPPVLHAQVPLERGGQLAWNRARSRATLSTRPPQNRRSGPRQIAQPPGGRAARPTRRPRALSNQFSAPRAFFPRARRLRGRSRRARATSAASASTEAAQIHVRPRRARVHGGAASPGQGARASRREPRADGQRRLALGATAASRRSRRLDVTITTSQLSGTECRRHAREGCPLGPRGAFMNVSDGLSLGSPRSAFRLAAKPAAVGPTAPESADCPTPFLRSNARQLGCRSTHFVQHVASTRSAGRGARAEFACCTKWGSPLQTKRW